jgi:nickel-dependent lactate racemase
MKALGMGRTDGLLTEAETAKVCDEALASLAVDGKRVLVVVPDQTRSCPLDLMFRLVNERLMPRVKTLDYIMALGTHAAMTMEQIYARVGITAEQHRTTYAKVRFFNHAWDDPSQLTSLGCISKAEISALTDGLFAMDVEVKCNRMVKDYDQILIVGPVFPHEVVGFSGGNKYLFPGISGPEILNFFHWLGAILTNTGINGVKGTAVRKVVDRAASLVPAPRAALCMVVKGDQLAGLYSGTAEQAWNAAADLSDRVHIVYKDRPFHTVLSCAPKMYDELWVGAKCMYKLEPVVADGGRLIIYAPHIHEVSVIHGRVIEAVGYHTRDYFVAQWDRYKVHPWGVLAHSTHVKGAGTYVNGVETPRIEVFLATGIPEETCRKINLGYLDWRSIRPEEYQDREAEGILHVPKAGEILYRVKAPV